MSSPLTSEDFAQAVMERGNLGELVHDRELASWTWEHYEMLPPAIRHALQYAATDWEVSSFIRQMRKLKRERVPYSVQIQIILQSIARSDRIGLTEFAQRYRKRYGHELPCVAAGVTSPVPYQGVARKRARRA